MHCGIELLFSLVTLTSKGVWEFEGFLHGMALVNRQDEMRARLERWKAERQGKDKITTFVPQQVGPYDVPVKNCPAAEPKVERKARALSQPTTAPLRKSRTSVDKKMAPTTRKRPQSRERIPNKCSSLDKAQTERIHPAQDQTTQKNKDTASTRNEDLRTEIAKVQREIEDTKKTRDVLVVRLEASEKALVRHREAAMALKRGSSELALVSKRRNSEMATAAERRSFARTEVKKGDNSSKPGTEATVSENVPLKQREQRPLSRREVIRKELEEETKLTLDQIERRISKKEKHLRALLRRKVKQIIELAAGTTLDWIAKTQKRFENDFERRSMLWNEEADAQVATLRETMQATVQQSQNVIRRLRSQLDIVDRENQLLRESSLSTPGRSRTGTP